ncbi:TonB-dependent receptor [Halochromatium glycolicum]|uniref:TonB-dependent receptor n=1 Tax=Halochromatium glycolicum TaxID=85075 RepID=A0AAJ0U6Q6_9GAMM|nr:TonB-dependent receptor [Halochromatium glycolicum]
MQNRVREPAPGPQGLIQLASILLAASLVPTLAPGSVRAQTAEADSDASLQGLMTLLEQETRLATKNGMNADFVPGMATILLGQDLIARGVRNVGDALALVPGISQGLEMTGERQILSRGVGYGYASGNIKLLLDGVSMNSTVFATANPVLNIPIEQVARIEVIRGPGASVHGEYAFAGVIDVITVKQQRTLHGQAMEEGEYGGGGAWFWRDPERDLSFSVNALGLEGDGGVAVAEDALYGVDLAELSLAPGSSNESRRYRGLFADLRWGDLFAAVKVLDDDYGDYFGINHFLPPDDSRLASRQGYQSLQLGADLELSQRLSTRLRLEALRHHRDRADLYVSPKDYFLPGQPVFMSQDYQETRYRASADLHWRPNPRHRVLFGLEGSHVEVDEATWDWPEAFAIDFPWLDETRNRQILSLVAQDEYRLNDRVTLTGALRLDDYSDASTYLSPRLAAVWRMNSGHILKLQYARAFRPPTFYELEYPSEGSIDAAEIATYELGYIIRRPFWRARLILFQSDLTEPIVFSDEANGYINNADARLRGVELEYEYRFAADLRVDANLSYVDSVNRGTDRRLPGGTDLLGNLALLWRPVEPWTAALQLRYVGERERRVGDPRAPVDAYTTADLTLSYGSASRRGLYTHLGVKNLGDADVRYPDQAASLGGVELPYLDDYPRPGRRWWLSVGYAF